MFKGIASPGNLYLGYPGKKQRCWLSIKYLQNIYSVVWYKISLVTGGTLIVSFSAFKLHLPRALCPICWASCQAFMSKTLSHKATPSTPPDGSKLFLYLQFLLCVKPRPGGHPAAHSGHPPTGSDS